MKKVLSLLLCCCLVLSFCIQAFAAAGSNYRSPIPMIMISGDGDRIYKKEGNSETLIYSSRELSISIGGGAEDSFIGDNVKDAAKNIFKPFLLEGVLFNKWDNYYDALYKEISDLFEDVRPNENGEIDNNTDISNYHRLVNYDSMYGNDKKRSDGTYGFEDYHFWYDWRLDPMQIADELNQYIEAVKSRTGAKQVALTARCLGSSIVLAYIQKYGSESIRGIGLDGMSSNGSEVIGGALSGDFSIDGNAISRFLADAEALNLFSIDSLVSSSLEVLENSGVLNGMTDAARKLIYYKIEEGVVSALARSTLFTMPCYWGLVPADDFETAKDYVFGKEGSQMRTTYAGLIEKIDNYNYNVKERIPQLLTDAAEENTNICIISKYGTQLLPIVKNADLVGDQFASVTSSSVGATASKIGKTLDKQYIQDRIDEGKGQYISPDEQIDASTCLFPENTWFVKGVSHSDWTMVENDILTQVLPAEHQLSVDNLQYGRFIVAHTGSDEWETMTKENCNTENWSETSTAGTQTTKQGRLRVFIKSIINWFLSIVEKLISKLK